MTKYRTWVSAIVPVLFLSIFISVSVHGQQEVYRVKRSGESTPPPIPPEESPHHPTSPAIPQADPLSQVPPSQINQKPPPDSAKLYLWDHSGAKQVRRYDRVVEADQYLDHSVLGQVLKKYVTKSGWFNYRGLLRDKWSRRDLEAYVAELSAMDPSTLEDPMDRLAAWLNLYNSMIILDILKHYPVKSLMQIPDFFAKPRFQIGSKTFSLLQIEKEIFHEQLHEPRTILARVNGATSGPKLMREPFKATKIDEQLDEQVFKFLTDRENVRFNTSTKTLELNPTFLWYQEEFGDLMGFLRSYLDLLPKYFQVAYKSYDWELNDEKLH